MGWTARIVGVLVLTGWGMPAVYDSNRPATARPRVAMLPALGAVLAPVLVRPLRQSALMLLLGFIPVFDWWLTIPPSNTRDWQPDDRVLPYATLEGPRAALCPGTSRGEDKHTDE